MSTESWLSLEEEAQHAKVLRLLLDQVTIFVLTGDYRSLSGRNWVAAAKCCTGETDSELGDAMSQPSYLDMFNLNSKFFTPWLDFASSHFISFEERAAIAVGEAAFAHESLAVHPILAPAEVVFFRPSLAEDIVARLQKEMSFAAAAELLRGSSVTAKELWQVYQFYLLILLVVCLCMSYIVWCAL